MPYGNHRRADADLGLLTAALYDPTTGITTEIAQTVLGFATNARLAVASFLGLSITITARTDPMADQVLLHLTLLDESPRCVRRL